MPFPSSTRTPAPSDPILGLTEAFRTDPRPERVNLAQGVFIDASGETPVLPSVREAERRLLAAGASKVYRPIDGDATFRGLVTRLVLGEGHEAVTSGRAVATQAPGGTGGLRVVADLLHQTGGAATAWISDPTWPNHPQLFAAAGFQVRTYPYADDAARRIDEDGMLAALESAAPGDLVVLHGACHNPTGLDPAPALWRRIGDLVERKGLLPFVDLAYQGFGDGLREDAAGLLELARPGAELVVSASFSKTFSLYAERVGAVIAIARSAEDAASLQTHMKVAVRTNYSNPPAHGADIVQTILGDPHLRTQWEGELAGMRERIQANRRDLVAALQGRGIPGDWSPIAGQRGMFAMLGLTTDQVRDLRETHAVYCVGKGRINVAGLTDENLPRVVEALAAVISG